MKEYNRYSIKNNNNFYESFEKILKEYNISENDAIQMISNRILKKSKNEDKTTLNESKTFIFDSNEEINMDIGNPFETDTESSSNIGELEKYVMGIESIKRQKRLEVGNKITTIFHKVGILLEKPIKFFKNKK